MSDIKIFRVVKSNVSELPGSSVALEKSLQSLLESNLETFLGVSFLATEYSTGKTHGGRIDTLGIDENGCPVIIEYKRSQNENVINQGLFYLDWLMDHKAEFKLLVMEKYDKKMAEGIEWSSPRLLCIAGDFTKYDEHAVQQINRNIELIRYRKYGEELFLLELVNATTGQEMEVEENVSGQKSGSVPQRYKRITETLDGIKGPLLDLYEEIKAYITALGDDVQIKTLKYYVAFKRIKNFACMEVHPKSGKILIYVKVDPSSITLEDGFTRDVRDVGHFGTGDLEIRISTQDDFKKAMPLIEKSYEVS